MEPQQTQLEASMLRAAADAILCVSAKGKVLSWNAGAERIFGYTADQIIGRPFDEIVSPAKRDFETEIDRRLAAGETISRFDSERVTHSGQKVTVSVSAAPLYDELGRYVGSVRIARDVTAIRRKDAELNRLYAAARKLSSTLDRRALCGAFRELVEEAVSCDGAVVSIFDGACNQIRCAYVWTGQLELDPETLPVLNYDPTGAGMQSQVIRTGESRIFDVGERVAKSPGQFIEVTREGTSRDLKEPEATPPTPKSALMAPVKLDGKVLGVVQVMSHEEDAYGPEELRSVEALIAPLAVAFQNADLYDTVRHELAEKRAAERALRESEERYRLLAAELEERVRQRTAALEHAVDELTGFSYSISHDMRAPIRAIIASSRILLEDYSEDLSDDARSELKRQATAAGKLGALVDDLLQYARLGHREPVRECVDLSQLASSVAERQSQPGWPCEGAIIEIEQGIKVTGDPSMLEILLTILLENAGKYRRPGSVPCIRVGQENGCIFVSDDGIGFDMKFVGKLFRPFERLHRDDEYPGTGIGLANARRIVERHGGRIWAESPGVGKGAIVRFVLQS